ncbi:hypothetical protein C8255_04460 [filamentous cyanobacterium CCP3]|nr:hypothetical protein C8255_04460 [filamentous cyanobacterium CCP3]
MHTMPHVSRWILPLPLAIAVVAPATADPATPPRRAEPVSYFCYMVTTDGQVRDLSSLCGDASEGAARQTVVQSSEPCYFLDANGKPCQVASRSAARN